MAHQRQPRNVSISLPVTAAFRVDNDIKTFSAKFLSEEERKEVLVRLKLDRTSLADEYHIKYVKAAIMDWKIWVHMLITIGKHERLLSIGSF